MKIEQMCEFLHCLYNKFEKTRKNEKNRGRRFFGCIKTHENKMKSSRKKIEKRIKNYPNGKQNT